MRSTEKQFFIFVSDENPQMLSVVPVPRPQSFQKPSGRLSLGSMEGITASAAASMDQGMHCTVPPQCATTPCHHPVPPPGATTPVLPAAIPDTVLPWGWGTRGSSLGARSDLRSAPSSRVN